MSKQKQIKTVKHTRDILPKDFTTDTSAHSHKFQYVENVAREAFRRYGFQEIRTPIFEYTELFARGVGEETDIVSKEMYTWRDLGENNTPGAGASLTLRPENTASVIRAYIQHQMWVQSDLAKLFYVGPQFRREHGRKGRFRQFYQIGVEVIGKSDHPAIEAEVIEMLAWILQELKIENTSLLVNSVGCPKCRPLFNERLKEELAPKLAEMCGDCNRRFETNILRVLDCKRDAEIVAQLPSIQDLLCQECQTHFSEFCSYLDARQLKYQVDPKLVRGLDYYTRTAFEIVTTNENLGSQNALLGGGRYDGLSETLGGPPTKGFGFALGLDRFVISLPETVPDPSTPTVFIAHLGKEAFDFALLLAKSLRQAGISCALDFEGRNLKNSMKLADRSKARYALIIGEEELAKAKFVLRDMVSREQFELTEAELLEKLKN
ncbi:MAG: histidine--tRNA ligase [Blastocatellia bacterium]|nr:histidine--tRNA ligase [Blastocatellia bacterium]